MSAGEHLAWANQTVIHPVGLAAAVLGIAFALALRRPLAAIPVLVLLCIVPPAQRITIAGIDLTIVRLLILALWLRIIARGEYRQLKWSALDSLVGASALVTIVTQTILYGTVSAAVNRMGYALETAGAYFCFRCLVREWRDVTRCYGALALLAPLVASLFVVEKLTGRNMFAVMGGVPEFTDVREGRLRCQGAFAHPILAGVFWASTLPMFVAYYACSVRRNRQVVGVACALIIVFLCASSAPVAAVLTGFACLLWWPLRHLSGLLALVIAGLLIVLQALMEHGAAHLIARVNLVGGSTGWHRFHLMDRAIANISEWWLLGTRSTAHWGLGLRDVTNQYILDGARGGVLGSALLIAIVAVAVWGAYRTSRLAVGGRCDQMLSYAAGATILIHALTFVSVSYFGQILVLLQLQLAVCCLASAGRRREVLGGRRWTGPAASGRVAMTRDLQHGEAPIARLAGR